MNVAVPAGSLAVMIEREARNTALSTCTSFVKVRVCFSVVLADGSQRRKVKRPSSPNGMLDGTSAVSAVPTGWSYPHGVVQEAPLTVTVNPGGVELIVTRPNSSQ